MYFKAHNSQCTQGFSLYYFSTFYFNYCCISWLLQKTNILEHKSHKNTIFSIILHYHLISSPISITSSVLYNCTYCTFSDKRSRSRTDFHVHCLKLFILTSLRPELQYHYLALFVYQPTKNWMVSGRREFVYMSGVIINSVFITLRLWVCLKNTLKRQDQRRHCL